MHLFSALTEIGQKQSIIFLVNHSKGKISHPLKKAISCVLIFQDFTGQSAFASKHANLIRNNQMLLILLFLDNS